MTIVKSSLIALGLITATAAGALAHDLSKVNRTQAMQIQEIEAQRRAGNLTRQEYRALLAEQGYIASLEQNVQADGVVNGREYRALREAQRQAGSHIQQESTDRQVNYWRLWKWNNGWRGYNRY